MGASLCTTSREVASAEPTIHECLYPLWAVKVSDFLEMSGKPEAHHVLLERGLLYQWFPGMFLIFISHQWLSSLHPDPQGQQVEVLQKMLRGIIDGSLHVHEGIESRTQNQRLSSTTRRQIRDGFIFLDWFAIPQVTARKQGVNEDTTTSDAALAVESIPAYVELSNMFIALVPELTHKDTLELANYSTWLDRGWCRAELWCRLLSNNADTTVVVVYSNVQAEFMYPLDWQSNSIVEGEFTVEADRAKAARLADTAVDTKIQHLKAHGPLSHYRFYVALRFKLLGKQCQSRDLESFLQHFRFDTLKEAAEDASSMNGLMCAVFSGDTGMLRRLARSRADMNYALQGLGDLGYDDSQTALMAAMKSQQAPCMIETLIELRANVNVPDRHGLPTLYWSRSAEHVKVLLNHRADTPAFVLEGPAAFANPDTVQALLTYRCDPSQDTRASPLHALSLLSQGNRKAVETAKLLLASRADVNARAARPADNTMWQYHSARAKVTLLGFSKCTMMTRLQAIAPGISPLGYAALVGHEQLTKLYLDHGAELFPNDGGDLPEDLARNNHHYHLLPLLSTFST